MKIKGSLTIEAAYVFPFCFLIIGIICFLGIFLYNQEILKMTGYECILQTMEERGLEDETIRQQLICRAEQAAAQRTLGVEGLEVSVNMTASKIILNFSGTQKILEVPIEATAVYERIYPELTLRIMRGIARE